MAAPAGRRHILGLGCAIAAISPAAAASDAAAPPEPVRLREEQAFLARYRDDNARLKAGRAPVTCVFMGDSITERWLTTRRAFFSAGRVCRGISGQTTPEMLLRFRSDVVELGPAVVHIMAGTNDIAGNTGPATPKDIAANIMSMTEIALANGIRVIIASVLPAARYPWRPGVQPVEPTRELNKILKEYASHIGAVYADYYPDLADAKGGMRPGFAIGDVHPTDMGYQAMEPRARAAIGLAMTLPQQSQRKPGCYLRVPPSGQPETDGIRFEAYCPGTATDSIGLPALGFPRQSPD